MAHRYESSLTHLFITLWGTLFWTAKCCRHCVELYLLHSNEVMRECTHVRTHSMSICAVCMQCIFFYVVTLQGRHGVEGALTWGNQPVDIGQWGRKPAGLGLLPLSWNEMTLCYLTWFSIKWNSIKKVNDRGNITQTITNKNTWCGSGVHIYTQVRSVRISIWLLRETNWKIGSDAEKAVARHMAWGSGRSWSWQGGGEGWGGGAVRAAETATGNYINHLTEPTPPGCL